MQDWHQHEHQRINHSLEKLTRVVENGLSERTERIEKKVDLIGEQLAILDKALGHKVDAGQHSEDIKALWDHRERRREERENRKKEWAVRALIAGGTAVVTAALNWFW